MQKTRPAVVISPDEMNRNLRTIIIAPMTTVVRGAYPTRVAVLFKRKRGHIVLDQLRTVDKTRLVKRVGAIDERTANEVIGVLGRMFGK